MKAILFDIGNVLLFFDHGIACRRAAALCGRSPQEVRDLLLASELELDYDAGKIATEEFIERVKELLGICVPDMEVERMWCQIFWPNVPVLRLVEQLADSHRLILVSNTNELHMSFIRERFPALRLFHGAALSYQLGYRKPAREIYEAAIAQAGLSLRDCLYVDDVAEYCDAARALGLRAIQYERGMDLGAAIAAVETNTAEASREASLRKPRSDGDLHPRP